MPACLHFLYSIKKTSDFQRVTDKHRCSLSGRSGISDPSHSGVGPHTYIHTLHVCHAAGEECEEKDVHVSQRSLFTDGTGTAATNKQSRAEL